MPPRRIAPPKPCCVHKPSQTPDPINVIKALLGDNAPQLILEHINSRSMDPVAKHDMQERTDDRVMSLVHERVIPRVGNAARVYAWIERAQQPFATPAEEAAFFEEVAAATGNDADFLFMLRWGLMGKRCGEEAVVRTVLDSMFGARGARKTLQ